ncbi:multidrug/biocide efflux PACE transporter [Pseudomonas sp. BGr12]|uniref:multidrug/biocide efflux PACE transporter n=1 Tax=Pseudomonas sp. BGr12 TaxID=2936269 RepID=UPI002559FF39|nr:multidrug/biocide efflux PACE transporter [Pseudomonas sp. BJa5]MDL2428470.1 multidrug/biocide efflux PACE transporter [Pseudomonas sp. BJa5]
MSKPTISLKERILHAIGFEVGAVLICAPVLALVFNKPIESTGMLAILLSAIAMLWNMVYNAIVDQLIRLERNQWGFGARFLHGLGFEVGIIVLCLPVAAWLLGVSLLQALIVEAGFFAFILPYTMAYNWAFDKAKQRFFAKEKIGQACPRQS